MLLWSTARSVGIASDEFWTLTAREFHAITKRHHEREEREWMRSAAIQSTIANCNRDADKRPEPYTAADFMPTGMIEQPEQREPTQEEMLRDMRLLNASFGGVDLTLRNNA